MPAAHIDIVLSVSRFSHTSCSAPRNNDLPLLRQDLLIRSHAHINCVVLTNRNNLKLVIRTELKVAQTWVSAHGRIGFLTYGLPDAGDRTTISPSHSDDVGEPYGWALDVSYLHLGNARVDTDHI